MKVFHAIRYLSLLSLSLLYFSCQAGERQVTAKEVPQAVLQAFDTSYPGATVKEYAEEIEDGQTYFEISCEFQGRKIDALYKSDGAVAAIEEVISTDQLPDSVRQTLGKEFQPYQLTSAEKVEKDGKQLFEVKMEKGEKKVEVLLEKDGRIVKQESKEKEEEEKEEQEEE